MSLFESLEAFVGAGLIAVAPAAGCRVPDGAALRGGEFSAFLRQRGEGGPVGEILDRLAYDVWLAQDARGIQMHVAEAHAGRLPAILDRCGPDQHALAAALEARKGPDAGVAHIRLASGIIALASREGLIEQAQLSADVTSFLLELLFAEILGRPKLIEALSGPLAEFLSGSPGASRPAPSASRPATAAAPAASSALVPAARGDTAVVRADQHGLSDRALMRLSAIAAKQSASPGPETKNLEQLARWLQETCAQLLAPSNDAPEVRQLKARAAEALTRGDFEEAMSALQQIRSKLREQRRRTEQRLEEELESLRVQLRQEAEAAAGLAELALARLDFVRAADLFQEAAESLRESDRERRLYFTLRRADALWQAGEETADTRLLREAASSYASAIETAAAIGDRAAAAAASQGLGDALLSLADQERSPELLKQAIEALLTALGDLARETNARRWAQANVSLGNALAYLCEIDEATTERLEKATVSYRHALEVLTRDTDSLRWAIVNLNYATVLIRLGQVRDQRANWHAAATAMVPALEIFEAHGAQRYADQARRSLSLLHRQWNLLDAPKAAE
jgi:3-dehydroquinate dehydratase